MNIEIEKYIQKIYEKYGWKKSKEFKEEILKYVKQLYEEIEKKEKQ